MSEEDTTKLKKVELKKWKKTKKKKPKEEDFYLEITEDEKTRYITKVTKEEHKKGFLRVPPEFAKEIMKEVDAKNWNEVELIFEPASKNEVRFKVRKKSAYIV